MTDFRSLVPVLPVADLSRAVDHYRGLGFTVSPYESGEYAYAERGAVRLHLSEVPEVDPRTSLVSVYLYVDDADALAAEWADAGGRLVAPVDTPYGLREGAHVDRDGNLIRFGSPLE